MKRVLIAALVGVALVAGFAFWPKEYGRESSPDGKYFAVAKYRNYQSWLPMFPGAGGDKAGWIVILTRDGKEIGKTDVGMVSQIRDLRWSPASVELPLVATFKL
jgi:hypothetical protein